MKRQNIIHENTPDATPDFYVPKRSVHQENSAPNSQAHTRQSDSLSSLYIRRSFLLIPIQAMAAANTTAPTYGSTSNPTPPVDSSSFSTPTAQRTFPTTNGVGGASGSGPNTNPALRRSTSPTKPSEAPRPVNTVKNDRPIDIRVSSTSLTGVLADRSGRGRRGETI